MTAWYCKIKFILLSIIILFFGTKIYAIQYDYMTMYLIHNDRGSYNTWYSQRISYDPNGIIYMTYFNNTSPSYIYIQYSDDDGQTWTREDPNAAGGLQYPSITPYASFGGEMAISTSNGSYEDSPRYNEKSGTWQGEEIIDSSVVNNANQLSQIFWDPNGSWCFYMHATDGATYDTMEVAISPYDESGGPQLSTTYTPQSLAACMDDDGTEGYIAWREYNSDGDGTYYIKAAYYNQTDGWSAIASLDSCDASQYTIYEPVIKYINNNPTIMYYRTGVGTYTSKMQGMYAYADANFSWSSPSQITDVNRNNRYFVPYENLDSEVCAMHTTEDPNNGDLYEVTKTCLSGGSWTEPTIITNHSHNLWSLSIITESDTVHILTLDNDTHSHYYLGYTMTSAAVAAPQIIKNIL